ncbi:MAG: DoxX family protein [Acidimicrobiales bacterium]
MSALEWITTGILVLAMGGIGGMKLVGNETGIEQAERLGYDNIRIPIGIAEVLAAIGVLIGAAVTDLEWLGTAAAVGIIVMMIGAAGYHIRAGDRFEIIPSIVVAVAAALYIVAINA